MCTNLFVHAESILGLVDDATAARLVVVLLTAGGVGEFLTSGLLAVWDTLTVNAVSDVDEWQWIDDDATHRATLSPVLVTPSLTLSRVDLLLSGVTFSEASVMMVSEDASVRCSGEDKHTGGEILAAGIHDEVVVVVGVGVG